MLGTLLVGAGTVWIAGKNNGIQLGKKTETKVIKELPDAVAQFLNVTTDATDEVIIKAIEVLKKEEAELKQALENLNSSHERLPVIPVAGARNPIDLPSFRQPVSALNPLAVTTVKSGETIVVPLPPTSGTQSQTLQLPSLGAKNIQGAENVVLEDKLGNQLTQLTINATEGSLTISNTTQSIEPSDPLPLLEEEYPYLYQI